MAAHNTNHNLFIHLASCCLLFASTVVQAYRPGEPEQFSKHLVDAARERTQHIVTYNGRYQRISYPNGDVPDNIGVCTDVVIRSYRQLGIDLQKDVHVDMENNFGLYPAIWGLNKPDSNIDHRRVPNLQTLFKRKGLLLPVSQKPNDYIAGDIVTWMLPGNLPHIGIISDRVSETGTPMVIHNIGAGPVEEDMLFKYKITGHYRYYGNL